MATHRGPGDASSEFGELLASWRRKRGQSQLVLALDAQVSTRHLSFLENGRSLPSQAMIERLVAALQLPVAAENALRKAAGFAARDAAPLVSLRGLQGSLGNRVFDTAARFDGAASAAVLSATAVPLLESMGVRYFFSYSIRFPAAGGLDVKPGLPGVLPYAWIAHYIESGHWGHDPAMHQAGRAHTPFLWSDVAAHSAPLIDRQRRVMDEATDFGLVDGFIAPVRHANGSVHAMSMWGEDIAYGDPEVRLGLRLISACLLDGWERLSMPPPVEKAERP